MRAVRRRTVGLLELGGAAALGSVPFSYLLARRASGVDLRTVSTGTVSATNVYAAAGAVPFVATCLLDLGKGMTVALLLGRRGPVLFAAAAGVTVAGHNWSPFLKGAGGRGVLPALGVLLVAAPQGGALLLSGLAVGRSLGHSAPGCLAAQLLLVPLLGALYGPDGGLLGAALVAPMLLKRLLGNARPTDFRPRGVYLTRLVYDRDVR